MGTVKDVQGMMRYSRTATTPDVSMQELPERVRAAVNSIHDELESSDSAQRAASTRTGRGLRGGSPVWKKFWGWSRLQKGKKTKTQNPRQGRFWNLRQECDKVGRVRACYMFVSIGGPGRDRTDDLFHAIAPIKCTINNLQAAGDCQTTR
jgi:hypothetical protein